MVRFFSIFLVLILCSTVLICVADIEGKELRVIYPVSIESQAEKYLTLFQEQNPDVIVYSESRNGTSDVVSAELGNSSGYDVILVPDYITLENGLMPSYITWDVRYGYCDMVLAYSNQSAYASEITPDNWYDILARDNVTIGIVHPDVDARGWRSLITLKLADGYYKKPVFSTLIPEKTNISYEESADGGMINAINPISQDNFLLVNSTSDLIEAVKTRTVDYALDYRGAAYQHNLSFVDLPPDIDLSSAAYEKEYWSVPVQTSSGIKHSPPVVFTASIPVNATNPATGIAFLQLVLSEEGGEILNNLGLLSIQPGETVGSVPDQLQGFVTSSH